MTVQVFIDKQHGWMGKEITYGQWFDMCDMLAIENVLAIEDRKG